MSFYKWVMSNNKTMSTSGFSSLFSARLESALRKNCHLMLMYWNKPSWVVGRLCVCVWVRMSSYFCIAFKNNYGLVWLIRERQTGGRNVISPVMRSLQLASFKDVCLLKFSVKSELEYFILSNLNMIHNQPECPLRNSSMPEFRRKSLMHKRGLCWCISLQQSSLTTKTVFIHSSED